MTGRGSVILFEISGELTCYLLGFNLTVSNLEFLHFLSHVELVLKEKNANEND